MQDFETLAKLVVEARLEDAAKFQSMERATAEWKVANAVLTDRMKVLDSYIADQKNKAIAF